MKYWLGEEYIGFGSGAHSYVGQCRYSFTEDVEEYIEQVGLGRKIVEHDEQMSDFENAGEYLMLRLRTTHGISEEEYYNIYRLKMDFVLELLKRYEQSGWTYFKEGRWKFTPMGFLLSNALIGELLDAQTRQRTQISKPWQTESESEDAQMTLFDKRPVAAGLFGGRRLIGRNEFL
jgi:oxygen-independent coproporphyrinogen-3 oxidase